MLFPLFELQDLERGRVSDSSPSAMQPGVGACEHSELILVSVKWLFPSVQKYVQDHALNFVTSCLKLNKHGCILTDAGLHF